MAVDGGGNFSTGDLPAIPGNYIVSVKKQPWLRKNVGPVDTSSSQSGLMLPLTSGDIDGDNEVGIGDYAGLSFSYGSVSGDFNWDPNADLDGDGEVGIGDYAVLSGNYGLVGDN